jgi:hypothetical protein
VPVLRQGGSFFHVFIAVQLTTRRRNPTLAIGADDDLNSSVSSGYAQSFLQNPYYFMFASLAKPDDDAELHWLKVRFSFLRTMHLRHTSGLR